MQRSLYSNSQLDNDLTSGQHNLLFKNHNKKETTTINVVCSARIIKFQLQKYVMFKYSTLVNLHYLFSYFLFCCNINLLLCENSLNFLSADQGSAHSQGPKLIRTQVS